MAAVVPAPSPEAAASLNLPLSSQLIMTIKGANAEGPIDILPVCLFSGGRAQAPAEVGMNTVRRHPNRFHL